MSEPTGLDLRMPSEEEYRAMLNRLEGAMMYACQELALLPSDGAVGARLVNLQRMLEHMIEHGNYVPMDLPDASTPAGSWVGSA